MSEAHHRSEPDPLRAAAQPTSDFWRSLAEREGRQPTTDSDVRETARPPSAVTRRDALKLMSASAALAGLSACTKLPAEKIVPYVRAPEDFVPGIPLFYATAMPMAGVASGLLVESHLGRPTKVEGNPDHPASLGAADAFAQASVLTLYDPDRSQVPIHLGRVAGWNAFFASLVNRLNDHRPTQGEGLRLLTETITSPTLFDQIQDFLRQFPRSKWHQYEPLSRDAAREGARLAFGEYVSTVYKLDQAEVILALDSDFLTGGPGSVRYARDFTDKRRISGPESAMNRLYAVESTPSPTGTLADHRWRMRSSEVEGFARALASRLGVAAGPGVVPPNISPAWVDALARDLKTHAGSSLVVAGDGQPPVVHALTHAMNQALGNAGKTVVYTDPVEARPEDEIASLRELVADMKAGAVATLIIIDSNPVYSAPVDLEFAQHFLNVQFRVRLGLYNDETSELCHWHAPEAHFLESWSDARAYDGTVSIIQPLIAPLYGGRTAHELLTVMQGAPNRSAHDIVQDYWRAHAPAPASKAASFEQFWELTLNNGLMAGTAFAPKTVAVRQGWAHAPSESPAGESVEIVFRPDPSLWDGRFANNGWLQELPKPLTKLVWDNAALISPSTAARLSVGQADVVKLSYAGGEVEAPVFVLPGQADDSVTVWLGHGRKRGGSLGTGVGFNAYSVWTSGRPGFGTGLAVTRTGAQHHLVTTQSSHLINQNSHPVDEESVAAFDRKLVRVATLDEFRRQPDFAKDPREQTTEAQSLYPPVKYDGYAWGMSIDLNSCTGCNACLIACQSENNVAVVGKEEVDNGRDMQWIRVDSYFRGDAEQPEIYNEVVLCMHCENAPCEYVCPVGATVHSPEGLNLMVYNRCVGTRYCSNNCPYKVRRFNFKLYSDWNTPSLFALRNPDVTVRSRGVMEKCSYCVQRISATKIKAEEQNRSVRDGEIQTACQQTCPTHAIIFGNINDPMSGVTKLKAQSRNYALLTDLNIRPRTSYLARVRNPNPEIKES